jgi:hypothetical protein
MCKQIPQLLFTRVMRIGLTEMWVCQFFTFDNILLVFDQLQQDNCMRNHYETLCRTPRAWHGLNVAEAYQE